MSEASATAGGPSGGYRPSRTAQYVTLFRALESARPPHRRVIDDPYARGFLPWRFRALVTAARVEPVGRRVAAFIDERWPGPRVALILRTRVIDDALADALAAGARQVLILGSGFDSRAHRLALAPEVTVFEVDQPATLGVKRERVEALMGGEPAHVRYVPVDFNRDDLLDCLIRGGFDPHERTFAIWEGVTNYLAAESVDRMLRFAGRLAAGSRIVFTYVHRGILDGSASFPGAAESIATVSRAGEPFVFGFDPDEVPGYLSERGLRPIEDVATADTVARYYAPGDRPPVVSGFYRIALAEVRA